MLSEGITKSTFKNGEYLSCALMIGELGSPGKLSWVMNGLQAMHCTRTIRSCHVKHDDDRHAIFVWQLLFELRLNYHWQLVGSGL